MPPRRSEKWQHSLVSNSHTALSTSLKMHREFPFQPMKVSVASSSKRIREMHRRIRKSASDLEVVDEALLDAVPIMVLYEVEAVRGIKIEAPVDVLIVMETEGDDPILQLPLESVAPTWLINALCFATAFVLLSLYNSQQI